MSSRRASRLAALASVVGLMFGGRAAFGQTALLDRAKDLFRQGNELRKAGDCARALPVYLESRALVPSVANTMNAAVCMAQLGKEGYAFELYEELLTKFRADLSTEETVALGAASAELRPRVGFVDVASNVQGLIVIDGRARKPLPLAAALPLEPGTHVLRVVKEGYEPFEQRLTIAGGETVTIDAQLSTVADAEPRRTDEASGGYRRAADVAVDRVRARSAAPVMEGFWAEAVAAFGIGPGLGSGAESSCDRVRCTSRNTARGGMFGGRVGYRLPFGFALHIAGGYLALRASLSRTIESSFLSTSAGMAPQVPVTWNLQDMVDFSGPFASAGIGVLFPIGKRFEIGARTELGVVLARASDVVRGTITGGGRTLDLAIQRSGSATNGAAPFVLPELIARAHIDRFYVGLGAALGIFALSGPSLATGDAAPIGFDCAAHPASADCAPASALLRGERAFGPTLVALPSVEAGATF